MGKGYLARIRGRGSLLVLISGLFLSSDAAGYGSDRHGAFQSQSPAHAVLRRNGCDRFPVGLHLDLHFSPQGVARLITGKSKAIDRAAFADGSKNILSPPYCFPRLRLFRFHSSRLSSRGVFQVPFIPFVVGTLIGRGFLFFIEGLLGVRYGAAARQFVLHQKWASLGILLGLIALVFLVRHLPFVRQKTDSSRG